MQLFSIGDAVRICGISKGSIRNYSNLYNSYLSGSANPAFGVSRKFTANDLKLFIYVRSRTSNGLGLDDISATLPDGLEDFPWELPASEQQAEPKVAVSKAQIEKYEDRMIEAQAHIEQQKGKIDDLEEENKELIRENGELRGELKAYKRTWVDKLLGRK